MNKAEKGVEKRANTLTRFYESTVFRARFYLGEVSPVGHQGKADCDEKV